MKVTIMSSVNMSRLDAFLFGRWFWAIDTADGFRVKNSLARTERRARKQAEEAARKYGLRQAAKRKPEPVFYTYEV